VVTKERDPEDCSSSWKTLVVVSAMVQLSCGGGSSELDPAAIVTQCENAALRQIKSPSTAKFSTGTLSENMVQRFPDGSIVVRDWFDAQNSFGGIVRASLVCYMRADASGSVSVDSLRIKER
jgi:hypothetical protein